MPARTRRTAPAPEAQAEDSIYDVVSSPTLDARPSSPVAPGPSSGVSALGLRFSEALSWRAGRPIAIADLMRRLQALGNELQNMDQEEDDDTFKESFVKVAKELADPQLLAHKDRGVRAWTARCVVDLLRLCAPNAPFTEKQLRSIFEMITRSILPALGDPSNAYNPQHMYVLESLATVKSIVLVTDQSGSDNLIKQIFSTFFDILSNASKATTGEQVAKAVNNNMTEILSILVEESGVLPQDVVDMIVAQFLRADPKIVGLADAKSKKHPAPDGLQSMLAGREVPPAYNAAKTICNERADRMTREISKYFSDVIVDASGNARESRRDSVDGDDLDAPIGPNEQDLAELEKAHRLLRELWRACPDVLQNVVPQLEQELSAENVQLRVLATETLGDMASGIGAAGPPPPPAMDPAAYPPADISDTSNSLPRPGFTALPLAPKSFLRTHPHAYANFLGRRQDRSAAVRAAWTTGIGRILTTAAGSMGLGHDEEGRLVSDIAKMLNDSDERVRLAAVRAVGSASLKDVVDKLGTTGGVDVVGSVLGNLAERIKDRKTAVRTEAMSVFARLWGVAFGEIACGNEQVTNLLGGVPSKVLNTFYTNDREIMLQMDRALFEILLPMSFPPLKAKAAKTQTSQVQQVASSQTQTASESNEIPDPAAVRVERLLVLAKGLDEKAKKIFLLLAKRQTSTSEFVQAYVQACEDYNGGVMDRNEASIKERLSKLINQIAGFLPDSHKAASDLWKFAQLHDRRSYQLLRFAVKPEYEYRTMHNALKEFKKRLEAGNSVALLESLMPLAYRAAVILYNKSHVPAIMEYAKTDEKSLSATAHDVLTNISQLFPVVLKTHISDICRHLQENAPSKSISNTPDAVESLKACAAFARRFPAEIPSERKFLQAMANFALHGTPPEASKHAVSVIMASSSRKELMARELVEQCVNNFKFGAPGFLSRLAALSRLALLAPAEVEKQAAVVMDVAVTQILRKVRTPAEYASDSCDWSDEYDEEAVAKSWAIRVLVNRVRAHETPAAIAEIGGPVYALLNTLVATKGELSDAQDTLPSQKSRLRLIAARSLLKLSLKRSHDHLLQPNDFHQLAETGQDPLREVRVGFLSRLKKYLARATLPARFYTIPFLFATEPALDVKNELVRWIKARAVSFAAQNTNGAGAEAAVRPQSEASKTPAVLEIVLARLLSLLAHHSSSRDSAGTLLDLAKYVVFYLSIVATSDNVSLIYHVAERVKASNDAIAAPSRAEGDESIDFSKLLHILSDVATTAIRALIDAHGWTLTSLSARVALPRSLFTDIKDHQKAVEVAETNYLDEDIEQDIADLVRRSLRKGGDKAAPAKKRKSEISADTTTKAVKRPRTTKLSLRDKDNSTSKHKNQPRKTGKRTRKDWDGQSDDAESASSHGRRGGRGGDAEAELETATRRKSGRVNRAAARYRERDDSEDDAELEVANEGGEDEAMDQGDNETGASMPDSEPDEELESIPPSPPGFNGREINGRTKAADSSSPTKSRATKSSPIQARAAKSGVSSPLETSQQGPASVAKANETKKAVAKSSGKRAGRTLRSRA